MTKAVAAVAALILIERGSLDPDCPVEEILPEFASLRVLEGWKNGQPVMRAPKGKATVRHLATHTSGLEYELWNPDVAAYLDATGHQSVISGAKASLHYPLMTDPGTRWAYGPNFDWLGRVVEAVADTDIIGFCETQIFEPLGMASTMFEPTDNDAARLSVVSMRDPAGTFEPFGIAPPVNPEFYSMGHGLYGSAPDFLRFLRMLLNDGELDGRRILSPRSLEHHLASQAPLLRFSKMQSCSFMTADFDPFPQAIVTPSFGLMRNEADISGMRSAGSQWWAGMLNTHYWVDPKKGIAALFMTQSLPFADPRYLASYATFERAVYSQLA
jgi:CubicO group peptidase (beta-lactamase class C family)